METTNIKVIVRVVSANVDIDVDLPLNATATDIIETLLEEDVAPRNDHAGNPITYHLTPKGRNVIIAEDETLADAKIQEGDVILMTPVFVAGV